MATPPFQPYDWTDLGTTLRSLAQRLNDPTNTHWTYRETAYYLYEALRTWNALTATWVEDWTATYQAGSFAWQSTADEVPYAGYNVTSPRHQTASDVDLYTLAEYHLLEPPTGNVWTGTPQFQITDFSQALQRRRDQVLMATACNVWPLSLTLPPGQSRTYFPDPLYNLPNVEDVSVLDPMRVRFIPVGGAPSTLYREDSMAFEYFEPLFPQTEGNPTAWDTIGGPPLALTFDAMASVPNTLDVLAIVSAGLITPPAAAPLFIPDDHCYTLKWGMLADVLRKESESQDLERAAHAEKRYQMGLKLLQRMPWLLQARINGVAVDTPSITEADDFSYEWQTNPNADPMIVRGGIDFFAISPTIPANTEVSITLSMVANAPLPVLDTDPVQVSREVLDYILDYCQYLALWKHCGQEAKDAEALFENFVQGAMRHNSRLRLSGIFDTVLRPDDQRSDELNPRFAVEKG